MPINEKKKITNNRYLAKCAQINLKPPKADAEKIKAAAAQAAEGQQVPLEMAQTNDKLWPLDERQPLCDHPAATPPRARWCA